jgi:HK97 family phage prohead protease
MSNHQKAMLGTFKSAMSSKGLTIEGWANKAVVDRGNDLIPKSAWQLENFKKNSIILFNHDKNKPIGRAIAVEARDEGLYIKARISGSADPEISKIRDLIAEGVLNAFSVGFDSIDEAKSVDGHNEIRAAELFECSVVSLPMNQDSLFSLVKAYELDAVRTKALELAPRLMKGESDDAPAAALASPESVAEKAQAEDGEAEVDPSDPAEPADEPKALGADLELEWQALMLPKASFADQEAVSAYLAQAGMEEGDVAEAEAGWLVTLKPQDNFLALSELKLPQGVVARVGVCNPAKDEAEDQSEGEDTDGDASDAGEAKAAHLEAKELPTAPLAEQPSLDLPEELLQARQTNILLSQIVGEFQGLRQALLAVAEAQPPKAAPVPVAEPQAAALPESQAEQKLLDEYYATMADIRRRIDRLQA